MKTGLCNWTADSLRPGLVKLVKQVLAAGALLLAVQASMIGALAKPSAQLSEGANGGVDRDVMSPVDWVRGNVNSLKGHFQAGQSIPYRVVLSGLTAGTSGTIIIGYDNVVGGRHAIDYLTSNDRINETVDPLAGTGVAGNYASPDSTATIPLPPNQPMTAALMAALPVSQLQMKMWGGSIDGIEYVVQGDESSSGNQTTQIRVSFTAQAMDAVLSWGGHIGRGLDWGIGTGGPAIPGASFHTYLNGMTFGGGKISTGSQDVQATAEPGVAPDCNSSGPNLVCAGSTLTFSTTITGSAISYLWTLANNQTGASFPDGSSTTDSTVQINAGTTAGSFDVLLTVIGTGGTTTCSQTVTVQPGLTVEVSSGSACQGSTATLTATVNGSTATPFSYNWSGPDGTGPFADSASIQVSVAGTYNVSVTDANGCVATGAGAFEINSNLQLAIDSTGSVCDGVTGTLTATVTGSSATPFHYTWSGPTGTGPFDDASSITVDTAGDYTLAVVDANGCTATGTTTVGSCAACVTRSSSYWFSSVVPPPRINLPPGQSCATLQAVFNAQPGGLIDLGFLQVNLNQSLGLFWGDQTSTGEGDRSGECAARKRLSVELISAIANVNLLNGGRTDCQVADPSTGESIPVGVLILEAKAATQGTPGVLDCTTSKAWIAQMNALNILLNLFNESNTSAALPSSLASCGVGTTNFDYITNNQVDPTTLANCGCPPVP